jgi:hypothetical protein
VQHERVGVGAQFRDDERHPLCHEVLGDERHVAGQAVELRHDHRAPQLAGRRQRRGQFRPAVERVGALAGFHLDVFGGDGVAFRFGERTMTARCASMPRPLWPCCWVLTRM